MAKREKPTTLITRNPSATRVVVAAILNEGGRHRFRGLKAAEKRDYFFGSHDLNRIQFSRGRDLRLNPPQEGKPLNYFVYPYVEVDSQEFLNVALAFSFADVQAAVAAL
jgi:hypothetical protein